jgi:hypothetical protein
VALESRQEAYNYAKERFDVGLMNSFDLNQSQTLLSNAQSDVLTKYDYIFKIKILILFWNSNHQKLIHYVKEINLPLNRRCSCRYCFINILSKTGLLEIKMKARKLKQP